MEIQIDASFKIPIWINLPLLEWEFWGLDCLSAIASVVGKPLFTDQCTKSRSRLSFARILVEMEIGGEFPSTITLEDADGNQFQQKVVYEWKPEKCSRCNLFGHAEKN